MMLAQREGWVEWLTHTFLAWVAVLIFAALICLFVALAFLFAAAPSRAAANADLSNELPVSCATVRWFALRFSPEVLEAMARKYRLTREQRREAKACLTRQEEKQ